MANPKAAPLTTNGSSQHKETPDLGGKPPGAKNGLKGGSNEVAGEEHVPNGSCKNLVSIKKIARVRNCPGITIWVIHGASHVVGHWVGLGLVHEVTHLWG